MVRLVLRLASLVLVFWFLTLCPFAFTVPQRHLVQPKPVRLGTGVAREYAGCGGICLYVVPQFHESRSYQEPAGPILLLL